MSDPDLVDAVGWFERVEAGEERQRGLTLLREKIGVELLVILGIAGRGVLRG